MKEQEKLIKQIKLKAEVEKLREQFEDFKKNYYAAKKRGLTPEELDEFDKQGEEINKKLTVLEREQGNLVP